MFPSIEKKQRARFSGSAKKASFYHLSGLEQGIITIG